MVKALSWAPGQCIQLLHLQHRCLKIKCPEWLYCFLLAPHTHFSFVFHISENGALGHPANPARAIIPHSDTSKWLDAKSRLHHKSATSPPPPQDSCLPPFVSLFFTPALPSMLHPTARRTASQTVNEIISFSHLLPSHGFLVYLWQNLNILQIPRLWVAPSLPASPPHLRPLSAHSFWAVFHAWRILPQGLCTCSALCLGGSPTWYSGGKLLQIP